MLRFAAVLVLGFAGLGAINPALSWIYVLFAAAFELWLVLRLRAAGRSPAMVGAAPYYFSEEEAAFIGRFRFYFIYPALARDAASVLAALGLSGLLLAPWLTYRGAFAQAILVGANLFAVAAFTRHLAPLLTLRMRASKADQAALRLLELHDPLWAKIRAGNSDGGAAPGTGS
jgi:hypothetical protein